MLLISLPDAPVASSCHNLSTADLDAFNLEGSESDDTSLNIFSIHSHSSLRGGWVISPVERHSIYTHTFYQMLTLWLHQLSPISQTDAILVFVTSAHKFLNNLNWNQFVSHVTTSSHWHQFHSVVLIVTIQDKVLQVHWSRHTVFFCLWCSSCWLHLKLPRLLRFPVVDHALIEHFISTL